MANNKVRQVDAIRWLSNCLVLTDVDKAKGMSLMLQRYYIGIGPITQDSQLYKDYEANKANTEFKVNQFLADMISQPKG